jgi:hypothetical protein
MCQPLALLFTIKDLIVQYNGQGPINQQASLFIVICKYFLIYSRYNCRWQGVAKVKLSPNGNNCPFNWSVCPVIISSQIYCCSNKILTHQEWESNWGEICLNLCTSMIMLDGSCDHPPMILRPSDMVSVVDQWVDGCFCYVLCMKKYSILYVLSQKIISVQLGAAHFLNCSLSDEEVSFVKNYL